jgi:hypothetical protein
MRRFIQEKRLGLARTSFQYHLPKMAALPNSANDDLSRGFTVAQVAQKHGWPEPMVWSLSLEGKNDHDRFSMGRHDFKPGDVRIETHVLADVARRP